MANSSKHSDTRAAREELAESLRRVIADAEDLLGATADQTGKQISELRTRAQEHLDSARDQLADAEARLRDSARRVADATDDYVRENPWTSLGMAAALGVVVGILLGRR